MPKLDVDAIAPEPPGEIPAQFARASVGRQVRRLSDAAGLDDFVATHVTVPPGMWSAQRHWHEGEDELAVILSGEAVLVDEAGRHVLRAGDVAVFPKGDGNAHHLVNESDTPFVVLAVSLKERSVVHYPDLAMQYLPDTGATQPER